MKPANFDQTSFLQRSWHQRNIAFVNFDLQILSFLPVQLAKLIDLTVLVHIFIVLQLMDLNRLEVHFIIHILIVTR